MAYILILQLTLDIIFRDHVTHYITWTNIWYGLKLRNLGVTYKRNIMWLKHEKYWRCRIFKSKTYVHLSNTRILALSGNVSNINIVYIHSARNTIQMKGGLKYKGWHLINQYVDNQEMYYIHILFYIYIYVILDR